jgi:tripartite-type tricarboxylate transporter receptor subunit TctC
MTSSTRRSLVAALAASALVPRVASAQARFVPMHPVKFVVPFPPGGGADIVVRKLAEGLKTQIDQPIVVENKPGAGGLLGLQEIGRSPPDGYTIGHFISGHTTLQTLFKKATLLELIEPVCRLSFYNLGILVPENSAYDSLESLLSAIRAKPGQVSMGISGIGNPGQIAWELIRSRPGAPLRVNTIPFKGSPEVLIALRGGQLDFCIAILGVFGPYLKKGGGVRALAVTGSQRSKGFEQIPTAAEAGLPGVSYMAWDGITAPAGTPAAIVAAWHDMIRSAAQTTGYREAAERLAMTPTADAGAEDFARFVRSEIEREEQLVREGKLKLS